MGAVRVVRGIAGSAAARGVACAVLGAALLGAVPAGAAAPAGPSSIAREGGVPGHAVLALSVRDGERASGPVIAAAELTCGPDGGSHPDASAACRALSAAHGRLDRLPGDPGVCPMIYRAATAVAHGHWGARPVRFTHTYANACQLHHALRPVYDF